jgi:hypothetical protein
MYSLHHPDSAPRVRAAELRAQETRRLRAQVQEELYQELFLDEASKANRTVPGCQFPPAPRLVGIELNPGPRGPSRIASDIASIGNMIGAAVAATKKKNRPPAATKKKKAAKSAAGTYVGTSLHPQNLTVRQVAAPTTRGVQLVSGVRHSPFTVQARCLGPSLHATAAGTPVWITRSGTITAVNAFNIDPLGSGVTSVDFDGFDAALFAIGSVFLRYRFRKLVAEYVPTVNTGQSQSVVLAANPEATGTPGQTFSLLGVSSFGLSATTPSWCPVNLDLMKGPNAIRGDWLYCNNSATTHAAERQETPGLMAFNYLGATVATTAVTFGTIYWNYDIEFQAVGSESIIGGSTPLKPTAAAASSSSAPPPQHATTPPEIKQDYEILGTTPCKNHGSVSCKMS